MGFLLSYFYYILFVRLCKVIRAIPILKNQRAKNDKAKVQEHAAVMAEQNNNCQIKYNNLKR